MQSARHIRIQFLSGRLDMARLRPLTSVTPFLPPVGAFPWDSISGCSLSCLVLLVRI